MLCSTPFGITAVLTRTCRPPPGRRCCAQRLSASQRCSHTWGVGVRLSPLVLNAFRHHSGAHPPSLCSPPCPQCRAQRLSASQRCSLVFQTSRSASGSKCSTPFGITAVLTRRSRDPPKRCSCAQRLSASQRCSLHRAHGARLSGYVLNAFRHHSGAHSASSRDRSGLFSCSTPFGITAVLTTPPAATGPSTEMCSTPFGITAVLTKPSRGHPATLTCAQRLSASQRCSRGGLRLRQGIPAVLNAFRHHSGAHAMAQMHAGQPVECSTPFGITAVLTIGPLDSTKSYLVVLNAFRHHSGAHSADAMVAFRVLLCSTPFGITAVLTWQVRVTYNFHMPVCSTPFGITAVLTRVGVSRHRRVPVLNAFRHHSGAHSESGTRSGCCGLSAQRLSASQRCSLDPIEYLDPRATGAQRLSASQRCSQGSAVAL